jgi:lipopolysaccharide export system protein LptC
MPPGTDMDRLDIPELAAPRRVFKRKRNKGMITALKIALPLIAVSCVAYIAYWSRQVPIVHPIEVVGQGNNPPSPNADVKVQQVQYNGLDSHNRPYSITAEGASQPQKTEPAPAAAPGDGSEDGTGDGSAASAGHPAAEQPAQAAAQADDIINLQKLIADMTLKDGTWVALTADHGIYHRDAGTVDLSGNVTLFHDTGLSFQTDAATVDMKNDWARGDQLVEGQNADGEINSEGFEIQNSGQTILFTGRAYLKLFSKKSADGGGS